MLHNQRVHTVWKQGMGWHGTAALSQRCPNQSAWAKQVDTTALHGKDGLHNNFKALTQNSNQL